MEVKSFIKQHYEDCFKEPCRSRLVPDGISFNRLEEDAAASMEQTFEEEEIKVVVWNCDGCKTPTPDGYYMVFFKNH